MSSGRGWLSRALRREVAYVRHQLAGLREPGSQQRLEVRQIAKATLAAVLAWLLASRLLPREVIWMAPATAVIMVHATVYQTLTNGLRRVGAVAAGVILAGSTGFLIGLGPLSLMLIIPPALIAARWQRMGRHGTDVATTAVLMLSFGAASQERYLLGYVIATATGALCGAVVNTVLWPPLYHNRPKAALRQLVKRETALLRDIADGLRDGWDLTDLPDWQRQDRRLAQHLADAESAVADSTESRRYNLRRRYHNGDEHPGLLTVTTAIAAHLTAIVTALTHLDQHATARPADADVSGDFAGDYADLLGSLAKALAQRFRPADDPTALRRHLARARHQTVRIHERMSTEIEAGQVAHPRGWAISGSLLTDAERIMTILADHHEASSPDGRPAPEPLDPLEEVRTN